MADTIRVKANAVRGVTFLASGQRVETWVPNALYAVVGQQELAVGHGSAERMSALVIHNERWGTWYVSPALANA